MMAADLLFHSRHSESGQSILEIVFMMPLLFLFIALLYKINMAAQMAINNTQFARTQLFVLANNSPEYPRLGFRFKTLGGSNIPNEGHARMVLGVTDPSAVTAQANADDVAPLEPIPQIQDIARKSTSEAGSSSAGEVTNRTKVRVRSSASMCTQFNSVGSSSGRQRSDLTPDVVGRSLGSRRWPFDATICKYEGGS